MKKITLSMIGLICGLSLFAQTPVQKTVVNVTGNITSNQTWTEDKIYLLSGIVRIQDNVTLTIEPGTVVKGGPAPDGSNATCLLVDLGGKLNAIGTKQKPIIFTSSEAKGDRDYGDWGGIVIYGKAPVNKTNPQYEGGVIPGTYGGNVANDNSGTLRYVRIEFAGYPFEADRELNSLTMCGVGNGTTIEYVQTSYNNDDAFEWFGGTVNAKYLVAYKTNDDDWDVDLGFSGKVQFGVSIADTAVADISTKNGFEVDNDAGGSDDAPKTSALFSNMTTIGAFINTTDTRDALHGRGAHIRRNAEIGIYNSIFLGWREGIRMDGNSTFARFRVDGRGQLQNNIVAGNVKQLDGRNVSSGVTTDFTADFTTYFDSTANNNRKLASNAELMLAHPFRVANPDFRPTTGSPALTGASFTNSRLADAFFTTTTYVGAFSQNDTWMDEWTEFDPVNAEYDFYIPQDTTTPSSIRKALEPVMNLNVFPNPTNSKLTVEFDLLKSQTVNITVTDITGRVVMTVTEENNFFTAGSYKLNADVSNLNNGTYFINIRSESGNATKTIAIAK
jgi:hypothetical protein